MVALPINKIITPKKEFKKVEHPLKHKYPKRNAHYSFTDYFHFDRVAAQLQTGTKAAILLLVKILLLV